MQSISRGFVNNISSKNIAYFNLKNYKKVVHIFIALNDNNFEDELGNTTWSPVAMCGNEYILQIFHGGQLNFVLEKSWDI